MTLTERARALRPLIEKAAQGLADAEALDAKELYPSWERLCAEAYEAAAGYKFRHGGGLYKTLQESTVFQSQWVPGQGTESLFARIDESHAGTLTDPIPYAGNMELAEGLYYSQDGAVYRCTRSTGQPVFSALSELAGIYVELAA